MYTSVHTEPLLSGREGSPSSARILKLPKSKRIPLYNHAVGADVYTSVRDEEEDKESVYTSVHNAPTDHAAPTLVYTSVRDEEEDEESVYTSVRDSDERPYTSVHNDTQETSDNREDLYTIPHSYMKNGQMVTVHYTLSLVESRVSQYEGKLRVAMENEESKSIISNLRSWLIYWKGKRSTLLKKLDNEI